MIASETFDIDYEELYNSAPCGYLCSLADGKIVEVNQRFLEFTGYDRNEIIGRKSIPDFLTKAGKIYYDSSFLVILKLKGSVQELGFTFIKKDNTRIPVLINSVEVKDNDGNSLYIQSTVFDISQRKHFENQLLLAKKNSDQLSEELSEANKELQNFAYIATHDLKSPIIEIEGHFEYLKDKIASEDEYAQESIEFINESIRQFKSTIQGLTNVIKLKNGKVTLETIDLGLILKELTLTAESKVKKLNGSLQVRFEEDLFISGNVLYVKSILENIIGNAIKYHSKERRLKIELRSSVLNDFICIEVEDNGIGINLNQHKDKIFGMFNRFDVTREGTGMGLFLAKKMVEKMGGKISIASELGKGTNLSILFKRV